MIAITTVRPGCSAPPRQPSLVEHADARPRPSSRTGNASRTSIMRAIAVSTQPRKKPAIMPIVTPIVTDRPVPMNATSSDTRAPSRTREKMSRPSSSTPKRCSLLGPGREAEVVERVGDVAFGGGAPKSLRIGAAKIADEDQQDDEDAAPRARPCPCGSAARTAAAASAPPPAPCRRRSASTPWSSACSRSLAPVPVLKSIAPSGWFGSLVPRTGQQPTPCAPACPFGPQYPSPRPS